MWTFSSRSRHALGVPADDVDALAAARLFVSRRNPTHAVAAAGTVGVTALGMAGRGGGWGLAPAGQSLLLIAGGIARKPAVVDERVEPRDLLDLTVAFDHDVVDGAPRRAS